MKVIYNACFGGFGFSKKAKRFFQKNNVEDADFLTFEEERTNPIRVKYVEEHSDEASDEYAELKIAEVPDDVTDWWIDEYDGFETVYYVQNGKHYEA